MNEQEKIPNSPPCPQCFTAVSPPTKAWHAGWAGAQVIGNNLIDQLRQRLAEVEERHGRECEQMAEVANRMAVGREAAEAKLALVEQDARRYRWLRNGHCDNDSPYVLLVRNYPATDKTLRNDELDAAIDAAIASQGQTT